MLGNTCLCLRLCSKIRWIRKLMPLEGRLNYLYLSLELSTLIVNADIITYAVLSGNRNFEGRVHALTRANYLDSPHLVVAYTLAGTVDIDFEKEPIGVGKDGKKVFFRKKTSGHLLRRLQKSDCKKDME